MSTHLHDSGQDLRPDPTRCVTRYFPAGVAGDAVKKTRGGPVVDRILGLPEAVVVAELAELDARFAGRHRDLHGVFLDHAHRVHDRLEPGAVLSRARRLLLGACFTHEYATEGAALCNPSVVVHPDQSGVGEGDSRFVMSVRSVGEGHFSTIGFRTGLVTTAGTVTVDAPGRFPETISAIGPGDESASGSYRVSFPEHTALSERVLWPAAPAEGRGMEDARFVRFVDDDGDVDYYATYTAYDGYHAAQHLLHTTDFTTFTAQPLGGRAATGKGLALFPRKIRGRYAALSRADGETNSIAFTDDLAAWPDSTVIQTPELIWELIQLGNCGSPIETEHGWLVLTHGVRPMRTYALGALLLDLDDPRRVLARTTEPILTPGREPQDGYTPHVVYSCGAFAHGDHLVLPYGRADQTISLATLSISELVTSMATVTVESLEKAA